MPLTPPPIPPSWENLPTARQQELTHLLATLLNQYLTAHKRQTTSPPPPERALQKRALQKRALQESNHERTSQNP